MKKTPTRLPASRLAVYLLALLRAEPRMKALELRQSLEPLVGPINPGTIFAMLATMTRTGHLKKLRDGSFRATDLGMAELDKHTSALRTILSGEIE